MSSALEEEIDDRKILSFQDSKRQSRLYEPAIRVRPAKAVSFGWKLPRFEQDSQFTFERRDAKTSTRSLILLEQLSVDEEIRASSAMLDQVDALGLTDGDAPSPDAFANAVSFLKRLIASAHASGIFGVGTPQIGPADERSVDLFWKKIDRTLLINFLSEQSVATFYGKKPGGEISGRFNPNLAGTELALWLTE
jgi:hypothetical protein